MRITGFGALAIAGVVMSVVFLVKVLHRERRKGNLQSLQVW